MSETNTKEYWENYTEYWINKVEETNSSDKNVVDRTASDDLIGESYLSLLKVQDKDMFLDFGCGFCRLYPYYQKITNKGNNYYGVDIAQSALLCAKKNYAILDGENEYLRETDGVAIPFDDNTFDKIFCYGVFDACNQEIILEELLRVLKVDGQLLITGKNYFYELDDEEAYIAEVNARMKGHPNYFTNVGDMIYQLNAKQYTVCDSAYYVRRCDHAEDKYLEEMPERFYQWRLVIKKQQNSQLEKFTSFSNEYSLTYRERN
ncbi:MAG: class I SAM-dependent methyltransferase [Eubacteriales bacterium]